MQLQWLTQAKNSRLLLRLQKFSFNRSITARLLGLLLVIAIINVGAALWIYVNNNSVAEDIRSTAELSDTERSYRAVTETMLQTMLLLVEKVNSGKSDNDAKINENLESLREKMSNLKKSFVGLDRKFPPSEKDEGSYSNPIMDMAYQNLMSINKLDLLSLSPEEKSVQFRSLIATYTQILSDSNERLNRKFNKDILLTQDNLNNSLSVANLMSLITLLLIVMLSLAMIYLFNRSIQQGVKGILARIEAYKNSDLTYSGRLDREDEFGMIDRMLSEMGNHLREMIRSTLAVSKQLIVASQVIGERISENREASNSVKQQISDSKNVLLRQNDETVSISGITEQVYASTQEISAISEHMNSTMENMYASARAGLQQMNELIRQVGRSMEEFQQVEEASQIINQRYKNVVKALSGIQELNVQTNLLSLNASIESARAGVHGKAFAVVADAIRALSAQTNQIAKEITQELIYIQKDMELNSEKLDKFAETMLQSRSIAQETGGKFKGLETESGLLCDRVKETSTAIGEIAQGIGEIVTSVERLSQTSLDVNQRMDHVDDMSDNQNRVSDILSEHSELLRQKAQLLEAKAAGFRI